MNAASLQHIPVISKDTEGPYFFTTSPLMFTAMLQAYALASSGTELLMTSEKLFKILWRLNAGSKVLTRLRPLNQLTE